MRILQLSIWTVQLVHLESCFDVPRRALTWNCSNSFTVCTVDVLWILSAFEWNYSSASVPELPCSSSSGICLLPMAYF